MTTTILKACFLAAIALCCGAQTISTITSPAAGTVLTPGTTPTFCWTPTNGGAQGYAILVSAFPQQSPGGRSELGGYWTPTGLCQQDWTPIPANVSRVYVSLVYYPVAGSQVQTQYWTSYPVVPVLPATVTSPAPGSKLTGTSLNITFTLPRYLPFWVWVGTSLDTNNLADAAVYGNSLSVTVPDASGTSPTIYVLTAAVENGVAAFSRYQYSVADALTMSIGQGFETLPAPPLDDYNPTAVSGVKAMSTPSASKNIPTTKGIVRIPRADLVRGSVTYAQPVQDGDQWEYAYTFDTTDVALMTLGGLSIDDANLNITSHQEPRGWLVGVNGWGPNVLTRDVHRAPGARFSLKSPRLPGLMPLHVANDKIMEPVEMPAGLSAGELENLALSATIWGNSRRTYVIGPAFDADASPEKVRETIEGWVNVFEFAFLQPLLDGAALADLQPSTPLEFEIVDCLRRVKL